MGGMVTRFMGPIGSRACLDMGVPLSHPTELPREEGARPWPELVWVHRRSGPEQAVSGPAPNGPHSPARADTAPWRPRASLRPAPVTKSRERKEPGRPR